MSTLENAQENPLPSSSSDLSKKPVTKKKSRRVLSIEDKVKVIEALRGKSQAEVFKMFQPPLPQSTVATILKNRKNIMSAYEEGMYEVKSRKTMKHSSYPVLDIALSQWFKKVRSVNISATGPLLAEKARYFAEGLGIENFKASNGFLEGFKKRHRITGQTVSGEEKSVDPEIVDTWSERRPDICRGYDRKDRFNADETGFYWRATPKETLNFKGKKCSGGKQSKERVTVMVACNQDVTEKLPLLVLGKSKKPRCFNHSNMDLLPVMYRSQRNASIDSELSEERVRKVDRKMKTANRYILLFIDNCTAHVSVRGLTNTKLIFFPVNCTSKLQPADQGIIKNLKVQYHQTMIRNMLQFLDENKPIKDINLKDSVFMIAKSWDNVTATTIKNCWRKANFPDEVTEPTHDPFESSDEEDVETTIERGAGTIWEGLVRHCPSIADLSFSQFASLDDEIVTEKQLSAKDATRETLEAAKPRESQDECVEESDPEDDEIFVMEPKLLTPLQASELVRALRDFVMSSKESGAKKHEFLRSLSRMEDAFLKLDVTGKRQTRLQEYF